MTSVDFTEHVERVVTEIRGDAADGRFNLAAIASFSDLHDYVDANEYLINLRLPALPSGEWGVDTENRVSDAVDALLKSKGGLIMDGVNA